VPKNKKELETMTKICDHTSVGILIEDDQKRLLLFQRNTRPWGIAPPAGHALMEHGSWEDAARTEVEEEVGLFVTHLDLLIQGRKPYLCRREFLGKGGHEWHIYKASVGNFDLNPSERETKNARWYTRSEIQPLAGRTQRYFDGEISEEEWEAQPGIEPVWYEWLTELGIIRKFQKYRKVAPTCARQLNQSDYAARGGSILTLHGVATFVPGDYLWRNSKDQWNISLHKMETCYRYLRPDQDGWNWYEPIDVRYAVQMAEPFIAQGVNGNVGDYLVMSGQSEWPVDRGIFETEYELVEE